MFLTIVPAIQSVRVGANHSVPTPGGLMVAKRSQSTMESDNDGDIGISTKQSEIPSV